MKKIIFLIHAFLFLQVVSAAQLVIKPSAIKKIEIYGKHLYSHLTYPILDGKHLKLVSPERRELIVDRLSIKEKCDSLNKIIGSLQRCDSCIFFNVRLLIRLKRRIVGKMDIELPSGGHLLRFKKKVYILPREALEAIIQLFSSLKNDENFKVI
jgi:hypothetical protein